LIIGLDMRLEWRGIPALSELGDDVFKKPAKYQKFDAIRNKAQKHPEGGINAATPMR
jgi:hypothetical protein